MIPLIDTDIFYIKTRDFASKYNLHLTVLDEIDFVYKTSLDPFKDSSTTYGPRYVRVTKRYRVWPQKERAAHLIHESTHCIQFDRIGGMFGFYFKYIFGWMSTLEAEANLWQQQFINDAR